VVSVRTILGLDSRSRFSDLSFHSQLWTYIRLKVSNAWLYSDDRDVCTELDCDESKKLILFKTASSVSR
jgi:hypothetical protein